MSQLTIQKTSSLLSKLKEFQIISQSLRRYTVKMYGQQLCYCQDSTYDRCRGFNKSIDKSVISSAFSSLNYHFLLIGDVRQTPGRTYATKVPKKEPKGKLDTTEIRKKNVF